MKLGNLQAIDSLEPAEIEADSAGLEFEESASINETIFWNRLFLAPYIYELDEEGKELIKDWHNKVEEITVIIKDFIESGQIPTLPDWLPARVFHKRLLEKALGENPSPHDITLFAIGTFVKTNYRKFSYLQAVMKLMRGGAFHLSDIPKTKNITCIDSTVMVQELAKSFGFSGSIHFVSRNWHHYWQEGGDGKGEGSIVDVTGCALTNGFVRDSKEYGKMIIENKSARKKRRK